MTRYAIYYAPDQDSPLWHAAAEWLGRDAATGVKIDRPSLVEGLGDDRFNARLANAARYGFHGTLKAPFELADGCDIDQLEEALQHYCTNSDPFILSKFVIGQLGPFFALVLEKPSDDLSILATDLVRKFDPFRAPMTEADLARRNPDKLSPVQRENLLNWGYPYIFEDFRFHLTLTDPIEENLALAYKEALARHFGPYLNEPYKVSSLALFVEDQRGAPFRLFRQFPLGAAPYPKTNNKITESTSHAK